MEKTPGADTKVAVIIATCERVARLKRALRSVRDQCRTPEAVIVVADDAGTTEADVLAVIPEAIFLKNKQTRGMSGTGAWNTGIKFALSLFGESCFVAIIDDDDEWDSEHLELCCNAARAHPGINWVVSGIERWSGGRKITDEPMPRTMPAVGEFFAANPGVQGSNIFVQVGALLEAGLFDEALASTTDRDLCIRLIEVMPADGTAFASTGRWTVRHHADDNRKRISTAASEAKVEGLVHFYYKYAPRMSEVEREQFLNRAEELFACPRERFIPSAAASAGGGGGIVTWSGDSVYVQKATLQALAVPTAVKDEVTKVLIGIISSDIKRISPLLADIAEGFTGGMVVVLANATAEAFADAVERAIQEAGLVGHVIRAHHPVVQQVLERQDLSSASASFPVPIAVARTVLQSFMAGLAAALSEAPLGGALGFDAALVLDDDKRLPRGWGIRAALAEQPCAGSVLLGRDIKTPPNPTFMSLRTQMLDLTATLHLKHATQASVIAFCRSFTPSTFERVHDQYYDMSSTRFDHLEMPLYAHDFDMALCRQRILTGDPIARDTVPTERGPSEQRGGCMLVPRDMLGLLATEQLAPLITLHDGRRVHSRRSDTFFVQHHRRTLGRAADVRPELAVVHENVYDVVPSADKMREIVVLEMCGAILCREPGEPRETFMNDRFTALHCSLARIRGLHRVLESFLHDEPGLREFTTELDDIVSAEKWNVQVINVIKQNMVQLREWRPKPDQLHVDIDVSEMASLTAALRELRAKQASRLLPHASRVADVELVGMGAEGVVFKILDDTFKVFDAGVPSCLQDFPGVTILSKHVLKRRYIRGRLYRGAHGRQLVKLLNSWRNMGWCFKNFKPDNCIVDDAGHLHLIDIGRDCVPFTSDGFHSMCKRAFLSYRFGQYAETEEGSQKLKDWMRRLNVVAFIPELSGFDKFMVAMNDPEEGPESRLEDAICKVVRDRSSWPEALRVLDTRGQTTLPQRLAQAQGPMSCKVEHSHGNCPLSPPGGSEQSPGFDLIVTSDHALVKLLLPQLAPAGQIVVVVRSPFGCDAQTWHHRRLLKRLGCVITREEHIEGVDFDRFEFTVEHGLLVIEPQEGPYPEATLVIRTCPMEHATILANVQQLVHGFEKVSSFSQIILAVDRAKPLSGKYLRQHTEGHDLAFNESLRKIEQELLVDHIVSFNPADQGTEVNKKFFGVDGCVGTHSESGVSYASTLSALGTIATDIVLMVDSDIFLHVHKTHVDPLRQAGNLFSSDAHALAVLALPILTSSSGLACRDPTSGEPYRYEVRCSFLHLRRLNGILPLAISEPDRSDFEKTGCLIKRGWYRVLDDNIKANHMRSYRGLESGGNFFVHPPNTIKADVADYMLVMDRVCSAWSDGRPRAPWQAQHGKVDLQREGLDWFGERNEWLVFVICGRNLPLGRALRCIESLANEPDIATCGVVLSDDASDNYHACREFLFAKARSMLGSSRLTTINTGIRMGYLANTAHLIRRVCTNPNSIIVNLDLDDCLLQQEQGAPSVVQLIRNLYFPEGSKLRQIDCACGGMIRHNKYKAYPLQAERPRETAAAGNVWQHLRSFAKELFDIIDPADLQWERFLAPSFDQAGADWTFMIPIVEQAGAGRTRHMAGASLYLFEESSSDRERKHSFLDQVAAELRKRQPYAPRGCAAALACKANLPCGLLPGGQGGSSDGSTQVHVFLPVDGVQVVALVKGSVQGRCNVPVRIHSECLTGDTLRSLKCDCGEQLRSFQCVMAKAQCAVLLYMKGHEGRGNGLINKIKAYDKLDREPDLNHVDALVCLGCSSDVRNYDAALAVLEQELQVESIVLYTNNPDKLEAVERRFPKSRRVAMPAWPSKHNLKYLEEKKELMGHTMLLPQPMDTLSDDLEAVHLPRAVVLEFHEVDGQTAVPGLELLRGLIRSVLAKAPFQNVSFLLSMSSRPSPKRIIADVTDGRGGLCFVLNPFMWLLLKSFGFEVAFVAGTTQRQADCCITKPDAELMPDHIALLVTVDGRDFWVDVGNGSPYTEPLELGSCEVVRHPHIAYRVVKVKEDGDTYQVQHYKWASNGPWKTNYFFDARRLRYSALDGVVARHFAGLDSSPFHLGLRLNCWTETGGWFVRDNSVCKYADGKVIESRQLFSSEELQEWLDSWPAARLDLERAVAKLTYNKWAVEARPHSGLPPVTI